MKNLPKDQRDKMIKLITDNPEFFEKISKEIQESMKNGKDQVAATMEVMRKHQAELQRLMMEQQ